MKNLILIMFSTLLFACGESLANLPPTPEQIDNSIEKGNFTEATKLIKLYLTKDSLTASEIYDLNFRIAKMERIREDFDVDDTTVIAYIKKFIPEVTKEEIAGWEKTNALENMRIDGKKKYFYSAGRNLFRIDSVARKHFDSKNTGQSDSLTNLLAWYI